MKNSFTKLLLTIALATSVFTLFSCKKEASEEPSFFDPGIDGVAVAPLPPIDEAMAKVSLNDLDAVPSHRYTGSTDEPRVAAPDSDDEADSDLFEGDETEMAEEEEDDFSFESDDFDSDDANSI